MMFSSVDLPDPDGPTMATNSPRRTTRSTPSSARVGGMVGYSLTTPRPPAAGLGAAGGEVRVRNVDTLASHALGELQHGVLELGPVLLAESTAQSFRRAAAGLHTGP